MECKKVQELISGYLDGELQMSEREIFEAHGRQCRGCAELLHETEAVKRAYCALPRHSAPPYFAARVMAGVEKDAKASWFDFFLGKPAYLKLAEIALALIVVVIGAVSGDLVTIRDNNLRPAEIRSSYSLDVFDPAPPDSIGGAFISVLGGNHE